MFNSLNEAARYAGVSFSTIRYWCREYGIGTVIGGKWRISKSELDRVVTARKKINQIIESIKK